MSNEVSVKHIVVKIGSVVVRLTPNEARALRDCLSDVVGHPPTQEIHKIIIRECRDGVIAQQVPWYQPYWIINTNTPLLGEPYTTVTYCASNAETV